MAVHEAAARGECTEAEAERLVRSFLSAGVDTTVNGIGNMLYAFAQHPEQWQVLRDESNSWQKRRSKSRCAGFPPYRLSFAPRRGR